MKCDDCGRFCRHLNDVWCNPYWNGIDREVCDACARKLGISKQTTAIPA